MNSFNKIIFLGVISFSASTYADSLILESNLDVLVKKNEVDSLKQDKAINQSSFYPELNLVTGVGSEYTSDKTETEKGGMLYLDSKINLFNGFKDQKAQDILNYKISKGEIEKDLEIRKVKNNLIRLIEEKRVLKSDLQLLLAEININQGQEMMAKKKVEAGLNTNAELLEFQIKEANIKNEISLLEINIKQKETEILNLTGYKADLDKVESELALDVNDQFKNSTQQNSLEKKVLDAELKISDLEVSKSKSEYSPRLDLEAKAGKIIPTTKLFHEKSEHQIALNLTIPLFSGFNTQAEIQKSVNERLIKEASVKNFNANYEAQLSNEKKKIELNKLLLKSNEQVLVKAIKFYEQSLVEYRRGIKNSTDLISASDRILELKRKINDLNAQVKIDTYVFNNRFEH